MMKFGKGYDLNLASQQYRTARIWETSSNIAKSFDEQFGNMYDANLVGYTNYSSCDLNASLYRLDKFNVFPLFSFTSLSPLLSGVIESILFKFTACER
jgi:hypothetical protein